MTKNEFKKFMENYPVFLDGATGSNLQKMGMPFGVCTEKWITENEDVLIKIQREYVESGSQIVYAPTFGANSIKLREYGLEDEAIELNKKLVEISKKAVDGKALVAGDITMCGQNLIPLGELSLEELIASYEQQIKAIDDAGADLLVIETMMSLQETRAALIAASNVSELPVMVTMTFGEGGKTLYGTDARTAAIVLESLGADAVGMNCSAGPDKMVELVKQVKEVTNLPVIAKPNAGMPVLGKNGETLYDMEASEFAEHMKEICKAGAKILGGCCGTNPEYIKAVKEAVTKIESTESEIDKYISSERNYLNIADINYCCIDAGTDEDIVQELEDDEYDTIYDLLDDMEDEEQNAVLLRVTGSDDELGTLKTVLTEITGYATYPIIFETENEDVLEYALKNYCGRAAVKFNDADNKALYDISYKYGACII